MSLLSDAITRKAEQVESLYNELEDKDKDLERFYDLCNCITDNQLLEDDIDSIKRVFEIDYPKYITT